MPYTIPEGAEVCETRCGCCGARRKCLVLYDQEGWEHFYCLRNGAAERIGERYSLQRPSAKDIARHRLREGLPLTAAQQALLDED